MAQPANTLKNTAITRNHTLMTMILAWCGLVIVSSMYITIPLISTLTEVLRSDTDSVLWVSSGFSFTYAVGFLFFGPLSERYGRNAVMFWGLAGLCIVTAAIGFVDSLPVLIAMRALQGLFAATYSPTAIAYAVEMFPAEKRVTAVGYLSTGFLMAGIIGQLFSSVLNQTLGWHAVFFGLGALYLISLFFVKAYLPKSEFFNANASIGSLIKALPSVFIQKPLFFSYVTTVTLLCSFVGMYSVLGSYLSREFSLSADHILYVRALGFIGMLLAPFAGRFVAKFGMLRVIQSGLILAILGLSLLGVSSSLPVLIAFSVVFVAGIALIIPTIINQIGALGGAQRGAAVTLYTFVLFLGASLGPILALGVLNSTSSYLLSFEMLAGLLTIGFLSTFVVASHLKKTAA